MIFTVCLWVLVGMIYFSNRRNKANIWCAINGFVFSLGAFKEVYYDHLVPYLLAEGFPLGLEAHTTLYSLMTATLYFFALPTALVFVFFFCGFDQRIGTHFRWLKISVFIPCLCLMLIYNPLNIRYYQLNDRVFWYVLTAFNVGYGIIYTVLMLSSFLGERNTQARNQKRRVAILILPALWYWLITIFIIHSLNIKSLFELWQGNAYIIGTAILFYIVMAFREGMMGIRLRGESYQWNTDMHMINKSMQFTGHLLKNELAKMDWCVDHLRKKHLVEHQPLPDEIEIISRSLVHIQSLTQKTMLYSGPITLKEEKWPLRDIIKESLDMVGVFLGDQVSIKVDGSEGWVLYGDKSHLIEVFNNLLQNAADAVNHRGEIEIDCYKDRKKPYFAIAIHDNGEGIARENIQSIFEPYFTTKNTDKNYGLGLSYCMNVIRKHNGYIEVRSGPNMGTTFTLFIPSKRITFATVAKGG